MLILLNFNLFGNVLRRKQIKPEVELGTPNHLYGALCIIRERLDLLTKQFQLRGVRNHRPASTCYYLQFWCRFFLFFQDWPESGSGSPIVHYHECQTFSKNKHQNRPQITQYISKTSLSLFGEFQIVGPLLVKRKNFLF